jgi:serine/threonine-protein kinase
LPRDLDSGHRLLEEIGHGGTGVVYRGIRNRDARPVAVKILHESEDPHLKVDFEREIRLLATLKHPHVLEVLGFGRTEDGRPYLISDLLQGPTLGQLLRHEGAVEVMRAAHLIHQVALALGAMHDAGVVHRGLSASGVMVTRKDDNPEFAMVLGLGPSDAPDGQDPVRTLAPEQLQQEDVNNQTDLYALGALFFQLVTGQLLFQEVQGPQRLQKILLEPAPAPSRIRPQAQIPMETDAIIRRCLEKRPQDRFENVAAFLFALTTAGLSGRLGNSSYPTGAGESPGSGRPAAPQKQTQVARKKKTARPPLDGRVVSTSPRALFISQELSIESVREVDSAKPAGRKEKGEGEPRPDLLRVHSKKRRRKSRPKPLSAPPAKAPRKKKRKKKKSSPSNAGDTGQE